MYLWELRQVISYWEPLCSIALEQQGSEFEGTVRALKENTNVDNLMQTGGNEEQLMQFKEESIAILESARFPVLK